MTKKDLLHKLANLYNQANKMSQRKDVAKQLQALSSRYLDVAIGIELHGTTRRNKISTKKSSLRKSIQFATQLLIDDLKISR